MNLKKTLLLALLLLAIGAYIKYFELPREESKKVEQELLKGVQRDELKSIEIISQSESFKFVNTAPKPHQENESEVNLADDNFASWQLAELPSAKLESAAMNSLLTALEQLRLESSIAQGEVNSDLSVYGLDKPALQVKIDAPSGAVQLSLGKQNEFVSKRYLKLADKSELYLVGEALYSAASKKRNEFRDTTPVEYLDSQLASIALKDSEKAVKFEAAGEGNWKLVEPIAKPASGSAVSALNMDLRNLSVMEFLDDPAPALKEKQLDPAQLAVTLEFKPEAQRGPLELALSAFKEKVGESEVDRGYLQIKGASGLFKLGADPLKKLIRPVDDWREKKLFKFVSDKVVQADFQMEDGKQLSIVKDGEGFQVNGKSGDAVFVRQLLRNLSELEAAGFPLENRDFGFNLPIFKVLMRLSAEDAAAPPQEKVLVVGSRVYDDKSPEIRYYASVDDLSDVFIIKKETLDRITPREEALVKLTPAATPAPTENSNS